MDNMGNEVLDTIDVEFTVRFVIKNAIDREALREDYGGDLLGYIRQLTIDEGLLGCVEDDYKIIEAKELRPMKMIAGISGRLKGVFERDDIEEIPLDELERLARANGYVDDPRPCGGWLD